MQSSRCSRNLPGSCLYMHKIVSATTSVFSVTSGQAGDRPVLPTTPSCARGVIHVLPVGGKLVTTPYRGEPGYTGKIIQLKLARESLSLVMDTAITNAYDEETRAGRLPAFDSSRHVPAGELYLSVGRVDHERATANIIGLKKGQSSNYILVTAHHDHLEPDTARGLLYPGANDNASGVAMMLRLARDLSRVSTRSNFLFVAFGAEERGCIGSRYFVENLPVDKKDIKVMVNLDMPGKLADSTLYYDINRASPFRELLAG